MTVVPVPTTDPECTHNIHKSPDIDVLTCFSTGLGVNEPADLTWYEDGQVVTATINSNNTLEISSDPDHQRVFVCRAVLAGAESKTCSITLNPSSTTPATNNEDSTTVKATTTAKATTTVKATTLAATTSKPTIVVGGGGNIALILGVVLGVFALLLLLLLLLLFLFCGKKRRESRDPEEPVAAPMPMADLPTMDPPADHTVVENPYGELPDKAGPSVPQTQEDSDSDYDPDLDKPWKKNPELLNMGYDGDDFSDDMSDGVGSATESYAEYAMK